MSDQSSEFNIHNSFIVISVLLDVLLTYLMQCSYDVLILISEPSLHISVMVFAGVYYSKGHADVYVYCSIDQLSLFVVWFIVKVYHNHCSCKCCTALFFKSDK